MNEILRQVVELEVADFVKPGHEPCYSDKNLLAIISRVQKNYEPLLEAVRNWLKHECDGDCMAECFWRDAAGEALERLDDTLTKDSTKESK